MINIQDIEFEYGGSNFRLRVPDMQISAGEPLSWSDQVPPARQQYST